MGGKLDTLNLKAEVERLCEVLVETEGKVAAERTFLQLILDAVPEPIMVIGLDYRIRLANRAARRNAPKSLNIEEVACCDVHCYQVTHHRDAPCSGEHPCPLKMVESTRTAVTVEHVHFDDEDRPRVVEVIAVPIMGKDGELQGIIESSRDITDRKKVEEDLERKSERLDYLSSHDRLTGLPNRTLLSDRLEQALARGRRSGHRVAVFYLDLDRFNHINESLGHGVGDALLKKVAKRIRRMLRQADTVARLAGDEFVVVVDDLDDEPAAVNVAEKILADLERPAFVGGHELHIRSSIGYCLSDDDTADADSMVKQAGAALYAAKQDGGGLRKFSKGLKARSKSYILLEAALHHAIERQQLRLHYQPQVALADPKRIVGVEALLRWEHPDLGMVSPGEFIPIAEESGQIVPVGDWVLEQSCLQFRAWQEMGIAPPTMAVNISARQFRQAGFRQKVEKVLERTGMEAKCLELEITERVIMHDADDVVATLIALEDLGVHISIDDFGTGYSSLGYLKRFPLDRLKVDRSFVMDISNDPNDAAITKAIIGLAHSLNLTVMAEGVEYQEQAQFLYENGCEDAQGYLFARPMAPEDVETMLRDSPAAAA